MAVLLILLFFIPELYVLWLTISLLIKHSKGLRLPWRLIFLNVIAMAPVIWIKYKAANKEIVFTGEYAEANDWGGGLANLATVVVNFSLVVGFFVILQAVFLHFFKKQLRILNPRSTTRNS